MALLPSREEGCPHCRGRVSKGVSEVCCGGGGWRRGCDDAFLHRPRPLPSLVNFCILCLSPLHLRNSCCPHFLSSVIIPQRALVWARGIVCLRY